MLFISFQGVAQLNIDSLWTIWHDASQPTENRLKAMDDIAWVGYLFTFPDSAFYYAQQEYELASKLDQSNDDKDNEGAKYMSRALNTQGVSFAIRGDNSQAIGYYKKGLLITERIGDQSGIAAALNNIGNTYKEQGDFANAIDYYTKSLKIQEELGNKKGVAATHGNIGLIHYMQENYPKAIEHHKASLEIEIEINEKKGISNCYGNMGMVYGKLNDFDKARDYHEKSLLIDIELNDKSGMANTLINIGNVFSHEASELLLAGANSDSVLNKQNSAINYYEKSIEVFKEIENNNGISINLTNIGNIYLIRKELLKAKRFGEESLEFAKGNNARALVKDASMLLYGVYKGLNKTTKALEMYELFIAIRDSIDSEKNQKEVLRQEYKYVYDKQVTADSVKTAEAEKVHNALLMAEKAENKKNQQQQYFLYAGLVLALLFGAIIFNRFKLANKQKAIIEKQKQIVDEAYDGLEEAHREITDSINYAERIQRSFLATDTLLKENLNDYFVFFQPKEAVSGDFYWADKLSNNNFAMVNADSTGHGVPGAIMSILNISSIEKAVEKGLTSPSAIFNDTRKTIIERLKKDGSTEGGKDGMDASIIVFDNTNNKFTYTAAQNPIWIVRDNEITEIKPEKMPIGKHDNDATPFVGGEYETKKGDIVYTLTDGFQDQFGGPKGKKFMVKKMREYISSISHLTMEEQYQAIKDTFNTWKGDLEQIDDVCVIGVRV